MPEPLRPAAGFDWGQLAWGAPDEPAAEICSYCDTPFQEREVPLMFWREDGWCVRFCEACQARWYGFEIYHDADADDDDAADDAPADMPPLGPCCLCEGLDGVRNILMLPVRGQVPGHGWGCVVCGLGMDGASAVLCDPCLARQRAGVAPRFACRGYPATDGRVPIDDLTAPHAHDFSVPH